MHVSILIPIIKESGMIQACMENLRALEGEFDVLFVDGGSTDGTLDIIGSSYPLISCAKGRAKQMNEGASHTSGDVLLFCTATACCPKMRSSKFGWFWKKDIASAVFGLPLIPAAFG